MLSIRLARAGHTRRYSVHASTKAGWEVRLEEDSTLIRRARYHDWHRLETAMALLEREIADLATQGWEVQAAQ